jgi:alpha-D-ribose 1-methylphosphonate 5-triphosphate synthase subunit PhnH
MKPSTEMTASPAFAASGSSARSVLRAFMEAIDKPAESVKLDTDYFCDAGVSSTALATGLRDLQAVSFVKVAISGRSRLFSLSDGCREITDPAEAARRIAEARAQAAAKAAQRSTRRRAASAKAAAVDAGAARALPEGIRRAVWPQLAWQQGGAS